MSFNELFGLGSYSPDINLVGSWKLQETTGTVAVDGTGNGNDGIIVGMGADPAVAAGPNAWLPSAFDLSGLPAYIDLNLSALGSDSATLSFFLKFDLDPPAVIADTGLGVFGESGLASHSPFTDGRIYCSSLRGLSSSSASRVTVGNPTLSLTSWRHIQIKTAPGANGWQFLIDGDHVASATGLTGLYSNSGNWWLGRSKAGGTSYWLQGQVAGLSIFNRKLTDAESDQQRLGPEPLNNGLKPMLHSDGAVTSVASWDSQSNGPVTRSTDLHLASDDSVVATLAGIDPDFNVSVTPGMAYYVVERGSNDGGFDLAEDAVSATRIVTGSTVASPREVLHVRDRLRVISIN